MDNILVVDDDQHIIKVIKLRLESQNFNVSSAVNKKEALELIKEDVFDLALVDLKLGKEDGIEVMEDIHQVNPKVPVIILTAHGTIENAVEAMKKGAFSYIEKPFEHKELLSQIKNCLEKSTLLKEVKKLKGLVKEKYGFDNIIVKSEKMEKVLDLVAHAAKTDSIVFIEGESGTGKELIAKALHVASPRRDGPFIAVNCAAIPDDLLESELFGYEKGAFTGAQHRKKGLLAQAHNGSFFFDELSEMSLKIQAKLLRVIEEKRFHPLGSEKSESFNARFITASNKNLEEEVKNGNFRHDLYYRVHVVPVRLPALRERKESIPFLAEHFLKVYAEKMNKEIKGFSPAALQKLMTYPWPGNVRELENTIECSVVMSSQDVITEDLVLKFKYSHDGKIENLKEARDEFEKNYLIQILVMTKGNVTEAAKLAGKYRADLYFLLKKHKINPAEYRK